MPAQTPPNAPPQTPQTTAVAKPTEVASDLALSAYAEGRELERIVAEITIPPDFQYVIEKSRNLGTYDNPNWIKEVAKVGITADGYDYLNRALGATFFFPRFVHDQQGQEQLNPIHRSDYIYLRLGIVYYTPLGQLVSTVEDIEVDFKLMYQDKRANAKSTEPLLDERGALLWDEAGNPGLKLNKGDELKCLRELTRARAFGPRYATTVGRVRLLKMATGLRSLPAEAAGRAFKVRIIAYRDKLNPEQRIAQATGDLAAIYGGGTDPGSMGTPETARPDLRPLTADEAEEVGLSEEMQRPDVDDVEREHVAEARANEANEAKPISAPWSAEDLDDVK